MIIFHSILLLFFIYLSLNVLYLLIFGVAGLFRQKKDYSVISDKKKISILIPTYREDAIILETARQAVNQDYPSDKFEVTVIADQLQQRTLEELKSLPIKLVEVSFKQSTKAKSLKYALEGCPIDYCDILMILDADNIMAQGCLEKVNHAFKDGFSLVQLHRTAKNKNTHTAILDAVSEEINNHIFRQGHRALGFSSALIGSGMAFEYSSFKKLMSETDIENNPGEDREIYLDFLKQGKICEYIENALVYDEKVQSGAILEKQRTRWISAQLQYANRFWLKEATSTFSYNRHYLDYAIQTLLLPRIMLLAITTFIALLSITIFIIAGSNLFPGPYPWIALFLGCIFSLVISAYRYFSFKELSKLILHLPNTLKSYIKAIAKSRPDQKEFIHTPKNYNKVI